MGWVAHKILVSAQGPLVLGSGAKILGPGLENIHSFNKEKFFISMKIRRVQ